MKNYLEELNEPQRQAVEHTEGPSMIIAGAGSGKTKVLTSRIAFLIQHKNIDPFNILALTFTNKAANEMRERIELVVGTEARNLWMGTFHSVFAKILRAEAPKIGYPTNFSIYDADDSKSLIKTIIKEKGLSDKIYKPNVVFSRISGAKNRLVSWKAYLQNPMYRADDESAMMPEFGELYKAYVKRCFQADAMDFDDLLFNTNVLFKEHVDVLNKYQQRFHYVMVDEFQDTNVSQYLITKKLAAVRENICVVGDDAQSIYAFRGADIQNILNFEKDYPDLKIFKLEQNYRSTKSIVNAANSVIAKNRAQLKKNIWTANPTGDQIEIWQAMSDNDEGKLVASSIFEAKMNHQLKNTDFAILYRTNSQSRAIEEALRKRNISYKILGGFSFYQRKEIKDILAYLKFAINPHDEEAFKRIINLPKRGIGDTTINKVILAAYDHAISIWEVINNINHFLSGRSVQLIADFVNMIKIFQHEALNKNAFEAAQLIARSSGLLKELYADKTVEGLNRYENVQELLNAISEFVENKENTDKSLGAFLQEITLMTGVDGKKETIDDAVTLMTVHMAKGLEFKYVYVVGMEEDLFPSYMMLESRASLEEERRLFYVAMTRAKQKLFLSYALTRYRFGRLKNCEQSRFLQDISPEYLNIQQKISLPSTSNTANYAKKFVNSIKKQPTSRVAIKHSPSLNFKPSDTSLITEGMRVEHPKFGFGTVSVLDVQENNRKAKVNFEKVGEKVLLLSFAKLMIIE